jgi:hypothetical protein
MSPEDIPLTVKEGKDHLFITGVESGTHNFTIHYAGHTPIYRDSEFKYPALFVGEDSTSGGNWGGKYGSLGYILCSYDETEGEVRDVRSLPAFVGNVDYKKQANLHLAEDIMDPRAPSPGPGNTFPRNAGTISTKGAAATFQTMTVDIELNEATEHTITLYFLDWDRKGRRSAVEIFDLETRRLIAPVRIVRDYSGGRYLTYQYKGSIRFRINHVRGPSAALSGIFFDPAQ